MSVYIGVLVSMLVGMGVFSFCFFLSELKDGEDGIFSAMYASISFSGAVALMLIF
jgi:hypothetical protein